MAGLAQPALAARRRRLALRGLGDGQAAPLGLRGGLIRRDELLKRRHLLATDACQVHSEDVYYGHLVLRLIASFVLYYTSRVLFKGRVTMDTIVFNLKHHWSSVVCQELELYGLS